LFLFSEITMFPLARTERISVREFAHETVVYDLNNNKVHCLSSKSALIWKHCDGRTGPQALADLVQQHEACESPEVLVDLALDQLGRRNLLQTARAPEPSAYRQPRREALRRMVAAAVAIPVIMSLTAPKARATGSAGGCKTAADCPARPCQAAKCANAPNSGIGVCSYTANDAAGGCPPGMNCAGGNCVPIPVPLPDDRG
jgi:hypothetical protein